MKYIDADKSLRLLNPATNYNLWVLFGKLADGVWVNLRTAEASNADAFTMAIEAVTDDRGAPLWCVIHGDKRPFEEE